MKKIIFKNIMIIVAFLVAIILISSSSMSLTINNISKPYKLDFIESEEKISNGLDTKIKDSTLRTNNLQMNVNQPCESLSEDGYMYGYVAYAGSSGLPEGPCRTELECGGDIESLAPTESDYFIAGATKTCCYSRWLGCEYGTGKIWEIDMDTGEMTRIGGGGKNLNGLAYDPCYRELYGSGDDNNLYKVDLETGRQYLIGPFGNNVDCMIGISCNIDGRLYGWDLGNDKLWTIDTETGAATEYASLGVDLNYAQDGDFDWDTGILWLTAYTDHGFQAYWDWDAEELVNVGDYQGGAQITGSTVRNSCLCCPEHDMALKSIDSPETGPAGPDMIMEVTVRNEGNNTETFDAQMEIIGSQSGSCLLEEDFSGSFPPEGWETDYWTQCNSSCCHESPCACLLPNYQDLPTDSAYITSKPVDASGNKSCSLSFYICADMMYPQYCSLHIKIRKNESSPWKDVTPWDNPLGEQWEGDYYQFDIHSFNNSEGCGEALQIKWEFIGYYYTNVCLDTVSLVTYDGYYEYAELVEDITLAPRENMQIEFPSWTPSHWQDPEYENTWVDYTAHAFTILGGDQRPSNNNKYKDIELYFGFFHDVGISDVSCPESGPAQTFPVTGHVKNYGQYCESGFDSYLEIAELDFYNAVELLNEDFSDSTFPPTGWTRTHNNWLYSYSSFAGGSTGEARFYYSSENGISRLFTQAIDTSEYEVIEIGFKHYVGHYITPYTLKLETSEDGLDWNVLWEIEPTSDVGPESINLFIKNVGPTTYVSWTFYGKYWNINDWFIDDIVIKGIEEYSLLEPEYEDNEIISEIEPGEELAVEFNDWTPVYLQYETTGIKKYMVKSWTDMEEPEDQNPDNDCFMELITLDFFHDVCIKNVVSPSNPRNGFDISKTFPLPLPEIYIQPGTESIDVLVENNGTFLEFNLTCTAQIWDYEDHNGSLLYEDTITDIDLEEPVGGTKLLNFDDFTFAWEGVYCLYLDIPLEIDDYPENNEEELIIGVDDTQPYSWHTIDPPEPDGENGWYINDVLVTICAEDPELAPGIPGSGICGFSVRINGESSQFFSEDCITYLITRKDDKDDVKVDYWAVDCAGNVESSHTFYIDMDQTDPTVDLTYEVTGGNKNTGWTLLFTATCNDVTSGMDRVEFFLNGGLQSVVSGSGPTYQWSFIYHGGMYIDIIADAYDIAGNRASDIVEDPKPISFNYNNQNSRLQTQFYRNSNLINNPLQSLFFIQGWFI
jgi:hypothetical protein